MVKLRTFLAACVVATAAAAAAQEPAEPGSVRTRMLDDVPDYGRILKDQWSRDIRVDTFEREAAHYGQLAERGEMQAITLNESIALALENNTGLRVQTLNPIAATARVRQAYAQFDPAVYGTAQKTRSVSPQTTDSILTPEINLDQEIDWDLGVRKRFLTGGAMSLDWTNSRLTTAPSLINLVTPTYASVLNLSLVQPLLRDFGWHFSLLVVDVAQIAEEQSYYEYKAEVANLVASVEQAYWVYVLAIENVEVEEKGLDLAKELLRQNQGRFNVGALPRTAVLESEAEVARREAVLVRVRAAQRITRDRLRALINARAPGRDDALLLITPADRPTIAPADLDLEYSLQVGYKERPELIAARLNVDGRKVERKIAENRLLPRLDFVGGIGLNGLGGDVADFTVPTPVPGMGNEFNSVPNDQVLGGYGTALELLTDGRYYQYNFGAVFEIPIGNADAKARYAEARVNAEGARLSLSQLEETVTLDITEAVNNLKAYLVAIDATRIARQLAEENVRNQQARYDVGLATTKDLIDFQDRLTQAERAEVQTLTEYNIELARLYRADGTLLRNRSIVLERDQPEPPPWWARF
jgi:outer membrane protein